LIDPETGETRQAQLFVAALGASSYFYVEGQWSQELPHWIGGHVRAFKYFGGVTAVVVIDYVPRNIIGVELSRFAAAL